MSTYGFSQYESGYVWEGVQYPTTGHNLYGLQQYSNLNVLPFIAVPRDYRTITLTWNQPQGTFYEFRLVANRFGFPIDQNDGDILIDSTTYPGSQYADLNVIPGTYHYYGIYMRLNNTPPFAWQRCAFASCLSPDNNGTGKRMYEMLPPYFREFLNGELTTDAAGNIYLQQFLSVLGWGMDYVKTQYDVLLAHLNDPMAIPLGDLVTLAGQLGMPFQPEVPAGLMRKALANWTHVCQERGTPGGLAENISLFTGYNADLQIGQNRMLENDQAMPLHPSPGAWDSSIMYALNELVSFGTFIYKCIQATTNRGNAPTGSSSSNTWWQAQQNVTDPAATLANPRTVGGLSTWQALYPSLDAGGAQTIPAGSLVTTIGLPDPATGTGAQHNGFSLFNKSGTTQDMMLRAVSQITSDRTGSNTAMSVDPLQAIKDGIPIPRLNTSTNGWISTKRYATNATVIFDGQLYQALRASTGATPPNAYAPLNSNVTFETGVTPWTAQNSATLAQSAAQAFQGSDSLSVTPDGSHALPGAKSELLTVIGGGSYQISGWTFITAGYNGAQIQVNWIDSFGQAISSSTSSTVNVSAATWTQVPLNATAPAAAVQARIVVQLTGTPGNTVVSFWDLVQLTCAATPEWSLISTDNRLRYTFSGYTDGPAATVQVIPFVEFYDESGVLITSNGQSRVTARVATPGTPGGPPNLTFDAFTLGITSWLNGRLTDTGDQKWTTKLGAWQISGFNGGTAYPSNTAVRNMAVCTGLATGVSIGVTIASSPGAGNDAGVVFRASDQNNYWRAGMTGLYKVTSGTSALIATYSTAASPGDRVSVSLSGNNITVFRNGVQVATTTDAYNNTATLHGIVVEAVGV